MTAAATLDTSRTALFSAGKTTVFSSKSDPRIAYCLFVPPPSASGKKPGLVVTIHGTGRNFMEYRDAFSAFGAANNMVVLAPLFPAGLRGDGNIDGYKYLIEDDIRYDLELLSLIDAVAEDTGCRADQFMIFGFSGGAHFVHRFLLVHPSRVSAAAIGAPGQVTLLDPEADWWVGVRDMQAQFGHPMDLDALRKVPVHLVIGGDDTETWEITHAPNSRYWRAEAARSGANRLERIKSLQRSLEAEGVKVRLDVIPGVKHESKAAMPLVQDFFASVLRKIDP